MRQPQPASPDTAIARLATQVDRMQADVDKIGSLERAIQDLAASLRTLGTPRPKREQDAPVVPEWLTVTDEETAVLWLEQLDQWVHDVWRRYSDIGQCWPWHPAAVADLLACRSAWLGATAAGGPADALATWHDRWQPSTAKRVDKLLQSCGERNGGAHRSPQGNDSWQADPSDLDRLAVWWATTHGSTQPPGLTRLTDRTPR